MLAMLSCIFAASQVGDSHVIEKRNGYSNGSAYPLFPKQPNRQIDTVRAFFPTLEVASSLLNPSPQNPTFRVDNRQPTGGPHSIDSSIGASTSDPNTPFSTGATPPSSFRPSQISFERSISQTPISASPEHIKQIHRSSSNLASALAASVSHPFSFSASASSSPPTSYPKKRLSPALGHLGAIGDGPVPGQGAFGGLPSSIGEDSKVFDPLSAPSIERGASGQMVLTFKTRLKNQDQFQNEGYALLPLLDPIYEMQYHAYRETYGRLLSVWHLPIKSCEILQYNGLRDGIPSPYRDGNRHNLLLAREREFDNAGLEIISQCDRCNEEQGCATCSVTQRPLMCLLCASVIRGLSSPCLNCGHVLHLSCRTLLEQSQGPSTVGECISGCGCYCLYHNTTNLTRSPTEDGERIFKPVHDFKPSEQQEPEKGHDNDHMEDEPWEDIAWESLTKNLGGRVLTPKPSQIWRGEERKRSLSVVSSLRRADSG